MLVCNPAKKVIMPTNLTLGNNTVALREDQDAHLTLPLKAFVPLRVRLAFQPGMMGCSVHFISLHLTLRPVFSVPKYPLIRHTDYQR